MPETMASQPELRPMTSRTIVLRCAEAVSRNLLIASMIVLAAVSQPIVYSEPHTSLSIVPGSPTIGMPVS